MLDRIKILSLPPMWKSFHTIKDHNPLNQEDHVPFNNTPLEFPEEAVIVYDPSTSLSHDDLNLPPPPAPLFMDFGRSGDVASASRNCCGHGSEYCLFGSDGNEWEGLIGGRVYDDQIENNGVLPDFSTMENLGRFGRGIRGSSSGANPIATERQRRTQMSDKYNSLRDLIPNPTKPDRASTVGDAIEYIKELTRTIHELKLVAEKKRSRDINQDHTRITKKPKTDHDQAANAFETPIMTDTFYDKKPVLDDSPHHDQLYGNKMLLRSSWLQRKSNATEVDVRIVDDKVTIKLVQRKKINLLLFASMVLDQLRLDIRHIAGGCMGDSYSFLFNTKVLFC